MAFKLNTSFKEEPDVNAQTEKAFSIDQANMAQYLRGNEEGDLVRSDLMDNENFLNDARTFLTDRQGDLKYLSASNKDVFEGFMNHFRHQDMNEWTTVKDLEYAQDLVGVKTKNTTKAEADDANKKLTSFHNLTVAYDKITGESGTWDFFEDYAGALVRAPSTYLGLITGGAAKAGVMAGKELAKYTLKRILAASMKGSIAPMAIEGAAGTIQGATQQKTRQELGLEGDPLLGGAIGFAGGAVGAGVVNVPLGMLRYKKGYKAGELAREATLARKARAEDAQKRANISIKNRTQAAAFFKEELEDVVTESAEAARKGKKPLPKEKVAGGTKIEEDVSPAGYLASLTEDTQKRIIAATIEIADRVGWNLKTAQEAKKAAKATGGVRGEERITMVVHRAFQAAAEWEQVQKRYGSLEMVNNLLSEGKLKKPHNLFGRDDLLEIAREYNLTPDQLAMVFIADASNAGRTLGRISGMKRALTPDQVKKHKTDHKDLMQLLGEFAPDTAEALDRTLIDMGKKGRQAWEILKSGDVLRRGLMTSQPKTTIRNLMNAGIRAPMYMLDHGLNDLLQHGRLTGFKSALKLPYDFLSRGDAEALALIFKEGNPLTYQRVFREAMDIHEEIGAASGFAKVGRKVNILNTLLDNGIKKSIFLNEVRTAIGGEDTLKAYMRGKGGAEKNLDFNDWFTQNPDLAAKAMDEALAFTYQKGFKKGTVAGWITQKSNNPLFTAFVPFPRFLVNQTQFMYEHMPLLSFAGAGYKKLKGKPLGINMRERFTKQATGSLFLYGALQVRAMQGPETPWNYIKDQNTGMLYDITALLGPFAPFFFGADVILRANKGALEENVPVMTQETQDKYENSNWDEVNWREVSKAFTGMQIKGGIDTGFVVLDELFTEVATAGQSEDGWNKVGRIFSKFGANYTRTFTIPVGVFKDLDATFDPAGRELMDTDSVDLWALFIRKALAGLPETKAVANFETYLGVKPAFSDALRQARAEGEEEQGRLYVPTGEQVGRRFTLSGTFSGATARQPFSAVEKELNRLNKPYYWWYGKDKNILADRIMKREMGKLSDLLIPAYIVSEDYRSKNRKAQVVALGIKRSELKGLAKTLSETELDRIELKGKPTTATEQDRRKFNEYSSDERAAAEIFYRELDPEKGSLQDNNDYQFGIQYIRYLNKEEKIAD